MSITFSYNGPEVPGQYMAEHGDRPMLAALSRLGTATSNQRHQDAATVYRAFVARDPYSDHAPDLDMAASRPTARVVSASCVEGKHELSSTTTSIPVLKTRKRADTRAWCRS
jgi:hypothetical protein